MLQKKYDYLVVGAGLFGATFAQIMSEYGKQCLILDRRNHIGGNVYTKRIEGINTHVYGAHIFHTNKAEIWEYVNRFAKFNNFINCPLANYNGEIYNLPFNMNTFKQMWGVTEPEDARKIISRQQVSSAAVPRNLEEQAISMVGRDIYEKLVKGYTEKQWGRPCKDLPPEIIKRLPLRFTYDNNYYDAKFQGVPEGGYTSMIEKMLENSDVMLGVDYLKDKEYWNALGDAVVFTGQIDEYFNYCYGALEYRSLRFETEVIDRQDFQGNAVVNYTDAETPYTRIIEHKHFEFGKQAQTVISREYSLPWVKGQEAFYPINDSRNNALYTKYSGMAKEQDKVHFCGRLGEYKYYDMDKTVERAMSIQGEMI